MTEEIKGYLKPAEDEINRLRAEIATMTAERDSEQRWAQQYHEAAAQFEIERDAARAEVERLRAALGLISGCNADDTYSDTFLESAMKDIAREALEVK